MIEWTESLEAAHRNLSGASLKFLDFVKQDSRVRDRSRFDSLFRLNRGEVRMQPWPTFINRRTAEKWAGASLRVFGLIKGIPQRVFDCDPVRIGDYYNISPEVANACLAGINENYLNSIVARGDFMISPAGLKCLEYNVSVSLGGWDIDFYRQLYLSVPIIAEFINSFNVKVVNSSLLTKFLEHIVRTAVKALSGSERRLTIAFVFKKYSKSSDPKTKGYLDKILRMILNSQFDGLSGEVIFCDLSRLQVRDGYVLYEGNKKIQAIIQLYGKEVSTNILKVFEAGRVYLFNGPITSLLGNKLNLAVLSENEDSGIYTPEEREIIRNYIPWTRRIVRGETTKGERKIMLLDFILNNKDRLVIKPPTGLGGENVHIGLHVHPREWKAAVSRALECKNWLIQEYFDSAPFLYQNGADGVVEHNAVWGFFTFGSRFAGAWVRVLPKKSTRGVINRHQGAEEGAVFEVME